MNEALENLIQALRDELQQYGEMLARLDQQQHHVINRRTEDLLQTTSEIEMQSKVMQQARHLRTEHQTAVALTLGLLPDASFAQIVPALPGNYRPLVQALVQENNESLGRIHQRSRQNHMLLCRSLEMMSRLLSSFMPGSNNPVYTDKMDVSNGAFPAHAIYQAIG